VFNICCVIKLIDWLIRLFQACFSETQSHTQHQSDARPKYYIFNIIFHPSRASYQRRVVLSGTHDICGSISPSVGRSSRSTSSTDHPAASRMLKVITVKVHTWKCRSRIWPLLRRQMFHNGPFIARTFWTLKSKRSRRSKKRFPAADNYAGGNCAAWSD